MTLRSSGSLDISQVSVFPSSLLAPGHPNNVRLEVACVRVVMGGCGGVEGCKKWPCAVGHMNGVPLEQVFSLLCQLDVS